MTDSRQPTSGVQGLARLAIVIAVIALLVAAFLAYRPGADVQHIALSALGGQRSTSIADMQDKPALLNVWASWCVACRSEHELLTQLAESGRVALYGLNFMDGKEDALRWLGYFGDPFRWSMWDKDGKLGRALGIEVLPVTLLIGSDGEVMARYEGPLTIDEFETRFAPLLEGNEERAQ